MKILQKHAYASQDEPSTPHQHRRTPPHPGADTRGRRHRWQVELMFKSLKSIAKIHVSGNQKPYRILSEIYAKLIAAVIRHAVMLIAGWRCIRHSLMKTAELITGYARTLLMSFHKSTKAVIETLKDIKRAFQNADVLEKAVEKIRPLDDSKTQRKTPKLTPMVRLETAPTESGENIKLPKYLFKLHSRG